MTDLLAPLPDAARVWLYVSDRPLAPDEQAALVGAMQRFFASWHTHRIPVTGGAAVLFGRVLVVAGAVAGAAGEAAGDLSGCGIDQHVREVERAGASLGVDWLGGMHVALAPASDSTAPGVGELRVLPRAEARAGVAAGTIPPGTRVLDTAPPSLGAVRRGEVLPRLADSPFARWLPGAVAAS